MTEATSAVGGATSIADLVANPDTFPKLLLKNVKERGDQPAMREKDFGIWQTWTWQQQLDEIHALACGLADLGAKRGDRIAIVGDNRPQLYWAIVAAQALGAIPVPVYQDSGAAEMQYVLDHAEIRFAVVEDQEQVDKLIEIKDQCPLLERIVFKDERGMRNYRQPFLTHLIELQEHGRAFDKANPDFFLSEIAKGAGSDTAIILYTSGTTGKPKGVLLSSDNLIITARNSAEIEGLNDREEMLSYLPMAWVGDNIFSVGQSYVCGFCASCPESGATVMHDLREIGPTYFFAPPRIFENILTTVMIRMEDAGWLKRKMFQYFMDLARRVGTRIIDKEPVSAWDRFLYSVGSLLVYGPLKNTLGFSRVRLAYTAGEAIGPDIFDFFRALGMNLKQLYGMTEASVFVTIQPDGEIKPDTVGVAVPDVEIKIAENSEVLFRSPGVFMEYYKNPEATRETKTADGWVHTGDAGFIGDDNHLRIIDRAKDVGKLNNGAMFAPKYIENKLKFFPFIKEAVAFGDQRDTVTAMISIDLEAVGNWAERRGLAYASYQDLASKTEVYDLIRDNVAQVNRDLATDSHLAGSQIHRFVLLHKELDADDGELTRTRKVRRNFIREKYDQIITALYSGADQVNVEAQVTFEDGRTGMIKADLEISDAEISERPAIPQAAE
ncbi:MAG: AMP-binding protein [Alphaproteobacteria bacterium]|nr:AMP-binding protein [Alphaproteobacteria bacterium]